MEIGLRRLDRFMTEPQRHHGAIDARPRWMASLSRPISSERRKPVWAAPGGSVSGGLEADGLRRRPECRDGVPLGGRAWLGEKCMTPSTQNHTPRLAGNPNPFACPCRFLVLSVSRGSLTGLALAPATVAGVDDERLRGERVANRSAGTATLETHGPPYHHGRAVARPIEAELRRVRRRGLIPGGGSHEHQGHHDE